MNRVTRRKVIQLGAANTALLAAGPRWAGRVAAQATPATGAPITIGLLAPVTGVFADFGDLMTKATNLAVQKVNNESGILGRPLTVIELTIVLEELDRVVAELEESLAEMALPLDVPSLCAARDAIAAARRP